MGKSRGGYVRGRGSGRVRISGIVIRIYADRGQHANYSKTKEKSGLSKSIGNTMFTYREKNSAYEIRKT